MSKKVIALLFILIIIVVGAYTAKRSHAVLGKVQASVGTELSNALSTKVSVGNIEVVSFRELAIDNPQIYDREDKLLLKASKVVLAFDPWKIIRGEAPVSAISELVFAAPEVNLYQHADGKWNVQDIICQQQTPTSAFTGKITFSAGQVNLDTAAGSWQLSNLGGKVDFAKEPTVAFKVTGSQEGQPFNVEGVYGEKYYTIHLSTDKIALAKYNKLLPQDSSLQLLEGDLTQFTLTVQQNGKELLYSGEGCLEGVGIDTGSLSLRNAAGLIGFTHQNLYLYGTDEEIAGQKIHTSGKITLNTDQPVFNLHITAEQFNPAAIKPEILLQGSVAFDVQLTGTADQPVIDGSMALNTGKIGPYPAEQAKASLYFADNMLNLRKFNAQMLGGNIIGSGIIGLEKGKESYSLTLSGDADGAQLDSFVSDLQGRVNYNLSAAGSGSNAPSITGTAQLAAGSWQGIEFSSLQTGFAKASDKTIINYLQVGVGQGILLAEGEITDQLNLMIRAQNVLVQDFCPANVPISGQTDVVGKVTGAVNNPQLEAQISAKDGNLFGQPFAAASGSIIANKDRLAIGSLTLMDGKTTHLVHGTVGLTGNKEIQLAITSKAARAENLVEFISPGEQLTGWVDNEVYISGSADNMNLEGHIVLRDGSFRGYLVEKGEGDYIRNNGVTTLKDFNIKSLNTQIVLAGEIGANSQLNLDLKAADIDISRLHLRFPYPVSGKAFFAGKLSGTPQSPLFNGRLQAANISINGQELKAVDGKIEINGSNINILDFSCLQGQGKYVFEGGMNLDSNEFFGQLSVQDGEISPLISMVRLPLKDVSGLLNGQISFNGTTDNPTVYLVGGIKQGKIKSYPVEAVDLDLALENNILTVNNFAAKQGNGTMVVRGKADLQGQINLEAGGYDLDAGIVPALFDTSVSSTGKLQFTAQITGTAATPHAAVSLEVNNGSVANAAFDNLYGLFIVDKDSIHVNQLYLSKGPYRASAYGLVPLKALRTEGYQQATIVDQMNLKLKLDQANLSILPLLTKEISWAAGQTKGEITIGGTLAQPTLNGQILVENGAVKIAALGEPIQKVGVDIQLEGDKIVVKSFTGQMGGGSYNLTGTASLCGLGLDNYNLIMSFDKLGIVNQYFKGPLNGTLFLTSVQGKPKLSGNMLFENDTINIPFVPQVESSGFDMALDLELTAGNRVRLYNSYLYDITIDGKAKFGGTLSSPQSSGHINAVRGSVSYLRTQFKITEGRADFIQVGSFVPNIKLSAETALDQTLVKLDINGSLDQMDIKLTSEPAMSQQEVLSLLTLRSRYLDKQKNPGSMHDVGLGRDEVVSLLDAGLQMRFISTMENTLKEALGLDQFRLVRDTLSPENPDAHSDKPEGNANHSYIDREVYNIEIGKYVTDRLLLSYTMGVDHKAHSMGFQYDLTRKISFTGSIDEQNRSRFGLGMRFNFN